MIVRWSRPPRLNSASTFLATGLSAKSGSNFWHCKNRSKHSTCDSI
jgi:hypothetical protein